MKTFKQRDRFLKKFRKIMDKWNQQPVFIRFKNGNTLDCKIENMERVSLIEALENEDWVTDWDCYLTRPQIKFVRRYRKTIISILNGTSQYFRIR